MPLYQLTEAFFAASADKVQWEKRNDQRVSKMESKTQNRAVVVRPQVVPARAARYSAMPAVEYAAQFVFDHVPAASDADCTRRPSGTEHWYESGSILGRTCL